VRKDGTGENGSPFAREKQKKKNLKESQPQNSSKKKEVGDPLAGKGDRSMPARSCQKPIEPAWVKRKTEKQETRYCSNDSVWPEKVRFAKKRIRGQALLQDIVDKNLGKAVRRSIKGGGKSAEVSSDCRGKKSGNKGRIACAQVHEE